VLKRGASRTEIRTLRLRTRQLRLGERDVAPRCDPGVESIGREPEILGVRGNRIGEQRLLHVFRGEREVVGGEQRLFAEPDVLEVGGAGLRASDCALDRQPHAAPEVGLPGRLDR